MKTNLAKNTLLLSAGNILTKGINFIMIPLFSSWLSTEDYGTFDLYLTYIALAIPLLSLASADALFRFSLDRQEEKELTKYVSTALLINILTGFLFVTAIGIYTFAASWKFGLPFAVLLVSLLFNTHLQGYMRAIKKLDIYSASCVVNTIVIAVTVSIFILLFHIGLAGIIYGYACGYIIGDIIIVSLTKYTRHIRFSSIRKNTFIDMMKYSIPLIPNNISWNIINVTDRTLINIFLGAAGNGIYAIACKVPSLCTALFFSFNISWQETAVETIHSTQRKTYFHDTYNTTTATLLSVCCGILAINYFLFEYIFDHRYHEGFLYCPLLTSAILIDTLVQFLGGILIGLKKTKENGMTTLIGTIVNIVLNILLIPCLGIMGAVISTLIASLLIFVIRYHRLHKAFCLHLDIHNWFNIVFYIYMLASCYLATHITWAGTNLMLASIFFLYTNKKHIRKAVGFFPQHTNHHKLP